MTLLEAQDISFGVGERSLCDALSLQIATGECWGVLGPNGCGKTTLLHTLAGLHPLHGGMITVNREPLKQLRRREIARQLGLLLQESHDPFPATVMETAMSGRHPYIEGWRGESLDDRQLALSALERMQLQTLARRQVQTLSGGERRRLAFATLLTQAPPLMLLDEPLNHLDLRHQQLLLQCIGELTDSGHGVMMVLHEPNQALHSCDRVLLLYGNGKWALGASHELLTAERLADLYGCRIEELEANGHRWFHYL